MKRKLPTAATLVFAQLLTATCGCVVVDAPARASVEAPAWERIAFGTGDGDLVGAIDLRAVRADPVFGPLLAQVARKDDFGVLARASQIDMVASMDHGESASWVAVVHGVDGPPRNGDAGSGVGAPRALPSGATEYRGSSAGDLVTAPGAWIFGEGSAFERFRTSPGLALPSIVMPSRALIASTVQGRAIPRPRHPELIDMTEGLEEVTGEILGGSHLELVLRCRYVDATTARRAATSARLVLLAEASRNDSVSVLARALTTLDFDVRGDVVWARVTISDDLRDLLQSYVERAEAHGGA